ncbi:MAG: hypothetical protein ACJ0PA_01165 [Flavobacteriaceae bacterium]
MKKSYRIACFVSLSISILAFIIWRVFNINLAEPFIWAGIVTGIILVWLNPSQPKS